MPSASKIGVDVGTAVDAKQLADGLGVSPAALVQVALDAQHPLVEVRERAQKTLDAWRSGTALAWKDLVLPDGAAPCLTVTLGAWQDELLSEPFPRAGHGVAAHWTFNGPAEVAAARGFWRGVVPGGAESCRIVAFRYGLPVAHLWAHALAYEQGRLWAEACWVARDGGWYSADDGALVTNLDKADMAVAAALADLVVYPSPSRNPVSWLVQGRRK